MSARSDSLKAALPGLDSIAFLVGLSFVAGLTGDPMVPFASLTYFATMVVTYYVSIHRGVPDACLMAVGCVVLLTVANALRSDEALSGFLGHFPVQVVLFATLACLPGTVVAMYESRTADARREKGEWQERLRSLGQRLATASRAAAAAAQAGPDTSADPGRRLRRANQLSEGVRSVLRAETVTEVARCVHDAIRGGLEPSELFLALDDGSGRLPVIAMEPASSADAEYEVDLRTTGFCALDRTGRAVAFPEPEFLGDGLRASIAVSVGTATQTFAVIGFVPSSRDLRDEADYATVLGRMAREVTGRFRLPLT